MGQAAFRKMRKRFPPGIGDGCRGTFLVLLLRLCHPNSCRAANRTFITNSSNLMALVLATRALRTANDL